MFFFSEERAEILLFYINSPKLQVQKQLELIRSVCDSMLDQQQTLAQQQHQQQPQLHNNLSPSPLYTEPRQFNSPMNTLNTVNTDPVVWFNGGCNQQHSPAAPAADVSNYQSVLATNTLQTQAFMLNTLNQCCQMLWLQQRELAALRSTVSMVSVWSKILGKYFIELHRFSKDNTCFSVLFCTIFRNSL